MKLDGPYSTARGVESAIKDAAKKAAADDPSLDTNKRIQLEYFNRFLSRIFSEGEESEWVLKGGASMLARIPSARSTRDIDLYRRGFTLDQALADLKRLAAVDLGDYFRFEYVEHEPSIGTETQPYTDGSRVTFNVFIGVESKGALHVDLVVGADMTGQVVVTAPATSLDLPRLTSHSYRLYPAVDQIADKICATMTVYDGRASSREKDLIDLVEFALTQDFGGAELALAIDVERRRRQMDSLPAFTVPPNWGRGYAKLSKSVPYCSGYRTVEAAVDLVAKLIDPVLAGEADTKTWNCLALEWT